MQAGRRLVGENERWIRVVGLVPGWVRRAVIRGTLAHPTGGLHLHLMPRPSPHPMLRPSPHPMLLLNLFAARRPSPQPTVLLNFFPALRPDPRPTVRVSPHATLGLSPRPDMGVRQA